MKILNQFRIALLALAFTALLMATSLAHGQGVVACHLRCTTHAGSHSRKLSMTPWSCVRIPSRTSKPASSTRLATSASA